MGSMQEGVFGPREQKGRMWRFHLRKKRLNFAGGPAVQLRFVLTQLPTVAGKVNMKATLYVQDALYAQIAVLDAPHWRIDLLCIGARNERGWKSKNDFVYKGTIREIATLPLNTTSAHQSPGKVVLRVTVAPVGVRAATPNMALISAQVTEGARVGAHIRATVSVKAYMKDIADLVLEHQNFFLFNQTICSRIPAGTRYGRCTYGGQG